MPAADVSDILVIGGGPAGAIAALQLSALGREVVLCEAAAFPREHIGVSFSPGVAHQLAHLDLADLLRREQHRHDVEVVTCWETDTVRAGPQPRATICDRAIFDRDLLAAVAKRGVRVLQPFRTTAFTRSDGVWRVQAQGPEGALQLRARFLVDASGRASRLGRRARAGPSTLAVAGIWRNTTVPRVFVCAAPSAWFWSTPTPSGDTMVVAFVDPKTFRDSGTSASHRYQQLVAGSPLAGCVSQLISQSQICDATPHVVEDEVDGALRIGDADVALDPMSSSGVQAAIQSSVACAPVVNTLLDDDGDHSAAIEFWCRRRKAHAGRHRLWSGELYALAAQRFDTAFWRARAVCPPPARPIVPVRDLSASCVVRLDDRVSFEFLPCLSRARVERMECVAHPALEEPFAFLSGIHLPSLLKRTRAPQPASLVVAKWSQDVGTALAVAIIEWAWRRGLIVSS